MTVKLEPGQYFGPYQDGKEWVLETCEFGVQRFPTQQAANTRLDEYYRWLSAMDGN